MTIMLTFQLCMIACMLLFPDAQSAGIENSCEERETALINLDIAEYVLTKTNDLFPNCSDVTTNTSECGKREKFSAHLEMAKKLISETKDNFPTCIGPNTKDPDTKEPEEFPKSRDCSEVLQNGQTLSGVYTIWPSNLLFPNRSLEVFCDMDTDGGGWTVVQRRGNFTPQEDFYREWKDYKVGFGNIKKNFWLGNDNLFILSNQRKYKIRFDLQSVEGENAFALYKMFNIENEESKYKLHIDDFIGNAGDSMKWHNGHYFYTKDQDTKEDCSKQRGGAWWYYGCGYSNLNGEYKPGIENVKTVHWYYWKHERVGLAASEIKIKAIDF